MTQITLRGRLAGDPELRFTPSGHAVANLTIVANKRVKNGETWEDGPATFWRCSAWRDLAENCAESLHKGTSVVAVGEAVERSWDDRETGQKRSVIEVTLDAIGPDLRWQTATVTKAERKGGFGQQPASDPWATGGGGRPAPQPGLDEPPF